VCEGKAGKFISVLKKVRKKCQRVKEMQEKSISVLKKGKEITV